MAEGQADQTSCLKRDRKQQCVLSQTGRLVSVASLGYTRCQEADQTPCLTWTAPLFPVPFQAGRLVSLLVGHKSRVEAEGRGGRSVGAERFLASSMSPQVA